MKPATRAGVRLALVVTAAAGAACGPKPPPPRFAESPEFHSMSGRVHGILEVEVDGDGHDDVAIAERRDDGYVVSVLRQESGDGAARWKPVCTGEVVPGEDIDALRVVRLGTGPTVFVLVLTENPEEVRQAFALVDLARCETVLRDQIEFERPDPELVAAPAGLRRGATMSADGTRLTMVDDPGYLHLAGPEGELRVLTSLRERVATLRDGKLVIDERSVPVLAAARLTVRTVPGELANSATASEGAGAPVVAAATLPAAQPGPEPAATPARSAVEPSTAVGGPELPELVDGSDETRATLAAGQQATVRIDADRPLVLLELRSGCGDENAPVPTLGAGGASVRLGERPPARVFVRATGVGSEKAGVRRDLVALRDAPTSLTLEVGPRDVDRCLRELKGYGFADVGSPGVAPAGPVEP